MTQKLIFVLPILFFASMYKAQEQYKPVWNGKQCGENDKVDVGEGAGSCTNDCSCPPCAPFCSSSGYCQQTSKYGQRACFDNSDSGSSGSYAPLPYAVLLTKTANCKARCRWSQIKKKCVRRSRNLRVKC